MSSVRRLVAVLVVGLFGFLPDSAAAQDPVSTGAAVLAASDFEDFRGQRVGVIVNHTSRVGEQHLVSLMHAAPEVTVGAIFGPEHGWRGTEEAGISVKDGRDTETGAPVYSLYGEHRKPAPAMLEGLDVLVFDIQDVGARFYTYISTMGLAMQAAAEAGLPFVVLDRPNPLSGAYVSGFMLEEEHTSFVGQYAIPIAHGMTVGELAQMIKGEALLPGLSTLDLRVAAMDGYERTMQWPDTELPWVQTSPNVPDFETALVYPGTCLFESTSASEGRGTNAPFLLVGAPWADGNALESVLNGAQLPGVRFAAAEFSPEPMPGKDMNPKQKGIILEGVRIAVTDRSSYLPVETGIHVLHAFYQAAPDKEGFLSRPQWLEKLSGTGRLLVMLQAGNAPGAIISAWQEEVAAFREARATYLQY